MIVILVVGEIVQEIETGKGTDLEVVENVMVKGKETEMIEIVIGREKGRERETESVVDVLVPDLGIVETVNDHLEEVEVLDVEVNLEVVVVVWTGMNVQ